ncbi:MAG: hypothetical protein COZ06_05260 [Armatimonadetes bacterium CG_4_10_14_3_um_filter_66_18]|nr:MAG: hypothetical protein COS65_03840 [Armatimonadetes bacterium CG06_land_8_20_14_3_00_66_21]PIX45887.1 MAG: hypothetical protein COZ57_14055 [Armatimonadetes bacterium CG_4_8_14_3_um_filter_66_20]PIY51234.1 MAG: hypothetical protein COZ06_05260 [Armatimonadetes bacterium CG_4_10_14_3_um_filter_66_18]PIZ40552.1 MAG: hypothetical protein COY42_21055 [Armatimonadetes bacterium CG_4_10_14_0_8_um_filter_66_14]PJB76185.1 MAG: hypothetical protein CO096_00805 [Armatimonadetes bacterium CG_4_9_14_
MRCSEQCSSTPWRCLPACTPGSTDSACKSGGWLRSADSPGAVRSPRVGGRLLIPVAVVSLIVWVGLFAYLWTLSRQVEALKRKLEKPE